MSIFIWQRRPPEVIGLHLGIGTALSGAFRMKRRTCTQESVLCDAIVTCARKYVFSVTRATEFRRRDKEMHNDDQTMIASCICALHCHSTSCPNCDGTGMIFLTSITRVNFDLHASRAGCLASRWTCFYPWQLYNH